MFKTEFLNQYLAMVEETESPRLFHVWAAIGAVSASLGRRCWFPFGPMVIFPNQYILIVGTPGTRKSTAASIMKRALRHSTGVRFAPGDTAGQRQGLVEAMKGSDVQKQFLDAVEVNFRDDSLSGLTLDQFSQITDMPESEEAAFIAKADKHHLSVVASEFSQFIGQNNHQMLDFLTQMWDGDDYQYKTKQGEVNLRNPLLNIIGCTTPSSIANSMPPAVVGQGFLSRMILVYGQRKYKEVPRPQAPEQHLVDSVHQTLNNIYYNMHGPFDESDEARDYSISLYGLPLSISDARFGYYAERRYTHLIKLAMTLAAMDGTQVIEKHHYEEAHRILRATEVGMPDALGEFGMNPLAAVKQGILELVRESGWLYMEQIQSSFHREANAKDIGEAINELRSGKQIHLQQAKDGGITVHAVYNKIDTEDEMAKLLAI